MDEILIGTQSTSDVLKALESLQLQETQNEYHDVSFLSVDDTIENALSEIFRVSLQRNPDLFEEDTEVIDENLDGECVVEDHDDVYDESESEEDSSFSCDQCEGCIQLKQTSFYSSLHKNFQSLPISSRRDKVMTMLIACNPGPSDTTFSGRKRQRTSKGTHHVGRVRRRYELCGYQVCIHTFCWMTCVSPRTINTIWKTNIVTCTLDCDEKKMKGRKKGTLSYSTQNLLLWLKNYVVVNGIPSPTGRKGFYHAKTVIPISRGKSYFLPCHSSKLQVYNEYVSSEGSISMTYTSFIKKWLRYFPQLKIHTMMSDFCDTCSSLYKNSELNTELRRSALTQHFQMVSLERQYYRIVREHSQNSFSSLPRLQFNSLNKHLMILVYCISQLISLKTF
jgi:hypothetical protein